MALCIDHVQVLHLSGNALSGTSRTLSIICVHDLDTGLRKRFFQSSGALWSSIDYHLLFYMSYIEYSHRKQVCGSISFSLVPIPKHY